MLSTRPKFLYLTNKQLQTISKRLISSTSKTSVNSSKLLNLSKTFFRSLPKTEQQQYLKQGKNVALVSGIIIVGSYIAFNQSNYYSLDTLPLLPPSSQAVGGTSAITANATASSFAKPPKLLEDKKLFSTSTSSMHQENSISHQQHKEGIFLLNDEQVDTKLRQFEESYFINRGKGVMRYDICQ